MSRSDADPPGGGSGRRERRRHPRHALSGVSGSLIVSTGGRVVNLSLDGIALETDSTLEVGRTYTVTLSRSDTRHRTRGQVIWCRQRPGAAVFSSGLHFEAMAPSAIRDLQPYLGEQTRVTVEKRLHGRFALRGDHPAGLTLEAPFHVARISLSGIEIRSDATIAPGTILDLEIGTDGGPLRARGRVIYSRRIEPAPARPVEAGIEFVALDDDAGRSIRGLIAAAA